MNPAKFSLRYPAVALILTAMAVAVGIYGFLYMPRTEDPTITIRTGLVMALYPGATSEQVEKQVTRTLEKHIFKFAEVRKAKTFSTSRPGLTIINVELEDYVKNADVVWSKMRNEMIEVSAKKELPEGVLGPIVDSDFGDTVALLIAIHGKRYGYRELRDYLDTIQDQLRQIPEVGKLAAYGEQGEQIRITGDLDRMSQYFVDPRSIIQALRQRNIIQSSGHFESNQAKIPLRTTGLFNSVDEIGNVLVKISPTTGQPLYIRDFAKVERRYQDPTFLTRYDGKPCLMLSVEMQRGKNIVELGENIRQVFSRLGSILPPDIKIDLVANQPKVVKKLINHLSHEFMIAIISVVLVTIILLPIRVAAIAALAIPITLSITLGVMNAIGITLNQVSIAALIVVLGIVVDDAIVIADNYVDLLDRKFSRAEAAKRCVSEVILPVFAATATIIFSFLPLLILTGSAGEFIESLPKTAAIALTVSFIVAIMITPIFCNFFIKSGLHQDTGGQKEPKTWKKFNVLNLIQSLYNVAIVFFMRHKVLAMAAGVGALVAAALLFQFVPQQFFPSAERNQFVIDVWMPQGSRIEATLAVMRRIEKSLKETKGITHFAGFVGQSAPRFYYNVDPQQPDDAYGQFIVDTTSEKQTPLVIEKLRKSLAVKAPEALVIVKELQQGMPLSAPVEVRIIGENICELKRLGARVKRLLVDVPYSLYVHSDTFNDSPLVDVGVNEELANRLGITSASVSALLAGGLDGLPVSTFWEGKRAVTMVLRLNHASRSSFGKVRDTYVYSPVTGASVPLRAVSSLKAQWQSSRIVRRNGVRTLTVQAFVKEGHYGSQLLNAVESKIASLPLPQGYRIDYGGEISNQNEVFPQMLLALGISIVAIFLTLLLQFRSISEALIVMASIPLALPGAALGLIITHNAFGFTAFMGFISLCGIVVRNAIILVDYVNEKMREGHSLEVAATEAGERRLRPIFLTTMAAAVGVLPMILSGSSLWSPLASVIAIGLVCSMFMTLLVVPVLFVLVKSHRIKPSSFANAAGALIAALLLTTVPAHAQTKNLSLPEAVALAEKGNSVLKIARFKIVEKQRQLSSIAANSLPQVSNYSLYMGVSNSQFAAIPVPGIGVIPIGDLTAGKNSSFFLNGTVLAQPVTQLLKIHEATSIARSDQRAAEADEKQAKNDIIFGVHQLYYGLLVAESKKQAAMAGLTAAQEGLREAQNGLLSRNLLEVGVTEAQTAVLKSRQSLLAVNIQIQDFSAQLNELLGLPLDTRLVLSEPCPSREPVKSRDYYLQLALLKNPQIRAAKAMAAKARGGVNAAREDYIPDVTLFAANVYQQGASLITNDEGMFGAMMSWNVWDWGRRKDVIGERGAQLAEAQENVHRLNRAVTVNLDKAYRALENQKSIIELASEALALQKEKMRLVTNQLKTNTISYVKYDKAVADFKKARSDDLEARLGYALAMAQLNRIAGTLAR